jgi:hypothetical protein
MSKNLSILFLLCFLSITALATRHLLSSFDNEFKKMLHHRNIGDTSKAFSIAMKLLVAVDTLKGDLEIEEPTILLLNDGVEERSCNELLN